MAAGGTAATTFLESLDRIFESIAMAEYLNQLQCQKWKINKGIQLNVEQIVLVRQQGLVPLH